MVTRVTAILSPHGRQAAAPWPSYERRRPEETTLHGVVREQLEGFLARAREADHPVPRFVEQALRAYLACGVLAHGFLRLRCGGCGLERLVPFSCKRRGFCPSCGGRRMADTAAHLVDCVLPEVPVRQWVLTLPYPLRYRCAYDARLALRLKTRWRDGTTHILMERHELLERLVPLIPPPRAHQIRYHGVLAPCASARDRIVPGPRVPGADRAAEATASGADAARPCEAACTGASEDQRRADGDSRLAHPRPPARAQRLATQRASEAALPIEADPRAAAPARPRPDAATDHPRPRRLPWAALLQRVFELDALRCPRCGASMALIAAIEDPAVARKILEHLALPARAPPLAPAADTSAWHDSKAKDEDNATWAFDQTPPEDDGIA